MTNEDFATWLRKEMQRRNWTQSDLSRHSSISTGAITRILTGERGVGNDSLLSIAKAFKLAPEIVFRAAGILPSNTSEESKLIAQIKELMKDLPPEEQENVYEYIHLRRRIAEERAQYEKRKKPRQAGT